MIKLHPDYYQPGQAPEKTVIDRQTAVLFLDDDLEDIWSSPSKRRQMAQSLCFTRWLVMRGVVNDRDGQP